MEGAPRQIVPVADNPFQGIAWQGDFHATVNYGEQQWTSSVCVL